MRNCRTNFLVISQQLKQQDNVYSILNENLLSFICGQKKLFQTICINVAGKIYFQVQQIIS